MGRVPEVVPGLSLGGEIRAFEDQVDISLSFCSTSNGSFITQGRPRRCFKVTKPAREIRVFEDQVGFSPGF